MKPGPVLVSKMLFADFDITAPPRRVIDHIREVALEHKWFSHVAEAQEAAEKWAEPVLALLRRELSEFNKIGRVTTLTFNSSSHDHLQGAAFIEPKDPSEVQSAKKQRSQLKSYAMALQSLTPREFEALCVGILKILGVDDTVLTQYSADEGIDFYGKLRLEKKLSKQFVFPSVQRQLSVWMVGQAKHYLQNDVSTPEIRELVGAVILARARAFGSGDEKYQDLVIRACDPVFFLFFTTGRMSANSWILLDRSGAVGMDGEMVGAFLADNGIGLKDGLFDQNAFRQWIESLAPEASRAMAASALRGT